ncbi:uncharacterized protein LOC142881256 [Nelusetta ayraudi]|uniref:uncharacterized protein LOC142881256 n=1 Tax=Nelusetta ayraudi TaxID=303726 RepID=UPI003F71C164
MPALVDSGADANLLDKDLAGRLQLDLNPLDKPIRVQSLDGQLLTQITHVSQPVQVSFPNNHTELISFHIFRSPQYPLVLGLPWLQLHNPRIDWTQGVVEGWGPKCKDACFPQMSLQNSPKQDTTAGPPPGVMEKEATEERTIIPTELLSGAVTWEKEVRVPAASTLVRRCRRVWIRACQPLLRSAAKHKVYADRPRVPGPAYRPGSRVWLSTRNPRFQAPSHKLAPRFIGPFPISRVFDPVSACLSLPQSVQAHPTFLVSNLKPAKESSLVPASKPPPPPWFLDDGQRIYTVRKLLAVRRRGRGHQYLVDWEGYGPEEQSWEPSSAIHDPSLIRDFHNAHPDPPRPSGAGR